MEYKVADKYINYKLIGKPYEKEGKTYSSAECKCPRCSGLGFIVARVENGQPIPIPVDGGVCYQCLGSGKITKEIRLYNEKEYASYLKNKEYRENKRIEQEKKRKEEMLAAAGDNKKKWLEENNFSEDGITYIITGDSYSIKDKLKAEGWKFSYQFLWHKADPAGYEDRVVKLDITEIADWTEWGAPWFHDNANSYVKEKIDNARPRSNSEWIEGDKVKKLEVTVSRINGYENQWGYSNIYTFVDKDERICVWFTAKYLDVKEGDKVIISGTIKDRKEFRGEKQTILTRCRVE